VVVSARVAVVVVVDRLGRVLRGTVGPIGEPCLAPPAARERLDDRQTQAGPAGSAAGCAAAGEALEQLGLLALGKAGALVEHGDPCLTVAGSPLDGHRRRCWRVVERVLDQVVEHDREVLLRGADDRVAVSAQDEVLLAARGPAAPAVVSALGGVGQRDRTARLRVAALAREREERRKKARKPLDLELGGLELGVDLRPAAGPRRLEAKAQPRERRPQLVRCVRDELALRREYASEALGHVVEGHRHLAVLGRPGQLRARLEIALLDPTRRLGEVPERPRERTRQEPCDHEPDQERETADRDQDEDAAPDSARDLLDALRDAHGADRPAEVRHRHGRVQDVLPEGVAVALSLGALAVQRHADLGSRRVRGPWRVHAGRVGQQPAGRADDDHAGAELGGRVTDELAQLTRVFHPTGSARGDDERLRRRVVLDLAVDPPREVEGQRDLERYEDQQRDVREGDEKPRAKAHRMSSGPAKRKPTPRTVCR
jgi:hypothetical protein